MFTGRRPPGGSAARAACVWSRSRGAGARGRGKHERLRLSEVRGGHPHLSFRSRNADRQRYGSALPHQCLPNPNKPKQKSSKPPDISRSATLNPIRKFIFSSLFCMFRNHSGFRDPLLASADRGASSTICLYLKPRPRSRSLPMRFRRPESFLLVSGRPEGITEPEHPADTEKAPCG